MVITSDTKFLANKKRCICCNCLLLQLLQTVLFLATGSAVKLCSQSQMFNEAKIRPVSNFLWLG